MVAWGMPSEMARTEYVSRDSLRNLVVIHEALASWKSSRAKMSIRRKMSVIAQRRCGGVWCEGTVGWDEEEEMMGGSV